MISVHCLFGYEYRILTFIPDFVVVVVVVGEFDWMCIGAERTYRPTKRDIFLSFSLNNMPLVSQLDGELSAPAIRPN